MLKIERASVYFKTDQGRVVHALDQVSLDIPDKGFVVALGASGCGKSTLLNAIAGFLPLSDGTITLSGRSVSAPGSDRGVVFQKDTLLPWKNVIENVALGLKFAGISKVERTRRSAALLDLVGLSDFAKAFPYELSGGMRQRVGIARALAADPDTLLMDEPFGALDSMTREQMQELLVNVWKQTGKRIFFITHSVEEALFLGTQVIVMSPRPGRIVARFNLDFVRQFADTGDARAVKTSSDFNNLREDIRALLHSGQDARSAAE
ncbi:Taurine import ATP-binding protein TauB [compost metagenome]